MPTYRALRSFAPTDAPPWPEGEERDVPAAQAADYSPHVEKITKPKKAKATKDTD